MLAFSLFTFIPLALSLATSALAHPGEHHAVLHQHEIMRRRNLDAALQARANHCAFNARAFTEQRKQRRAMRQRGLPVREGPSAWHGLMSKRDISAANGATPHKDSVQNTTCVLQPEAVDGPYYIPGELFRQNITDTEDGIPFIMDFGVLDITTCQPLANAFIDLWYANASGVYSGYEEASLSGNSESSGSGGAAGNSSGTSAVLPSAGSASSATGSLSGSAPSGAPTGSMPSGSGAGSASGAPSGGMGGGGTGPTSTNTALRGIWPTTDEGVAEIYGVLPGYYIGRSIHTHIKVHTDVVQASNNTILTNKMIHTGQIFFSESDTQTYLAEAPYSSYNNRTRTTNSEDSIYQSASSGVNIIWDMERVSDDIADGYYGYITLAVNSTATGDGATGDAVDVYEVTTERNSSSSSVSTTSNSSDSDASASDSSIVAGSSTTTQDDTSSAKRNHRLPRFLFF